MQPPWSPASGSRSHGGTPSVEADYHAPGRAIAPAGGLESPGPPVDPGAWAAAAAWDEQPDIEVEQGPCGGCIVSRCGHYRYLLWRRLQPVGEALNFVMMNPSTAAAAEDDATLRRCLGFARKWGAAMLLVTNLYAWRDRSPLALARAPDPVGSLNDIFIALSAGAAGRVLVAWGEGGPMAGRPAEVLRLLEEAGGPPPHCLRVTRAGRPSHPLYLPGDLTPQHYAGRIPGASGCG